VNKFDISSAGFFGNTLSHFKLTFVVVSNSLIVTDWKNGLVAVLDALLKNILDAITLLIETDTIMNKFDNSSAGFFGNALSHFKLTFVVVSNTFIITDRINGLVTVLDAFLKNILDTVALLIETDTIMDDNNVPVAGLLGNTLSDFKFTLIAVSDTFIVANWSHDLRA